MQAFASDVAPLQRKSSGFGSIRKRWPGFKPDSKPDSKPEFKPDSRLDSRAESRSGAKADSKVQAMKRRSSLIITGATGLFSRKEGNRRHQAREQANDGQSDASPQASTLEEQTAVGEGSGGGKENVDPADPDRSRQRPEQRRRRPLSDGQERVPIASAQKSQGHERSKSGGSGEALEKPKKLLSPKYLSKRRSEAEFKKRSSADQIEKRRSVGNLDELMSESPESTPSGLGLQFSVALRLREV
ncbi:uncharacterized protein BDZ83DRAFT_758790 [Colletotrichum acutatum]|uniref:Uncharacterized protein n=1 Tax=Glomerella acutata TaxID=27357 RepID=A0AAD8U4V5_GLOAC|nr:uncharacterized protein BDZ83DRAFT_758790 [Colletotrichum acutatum]KAK1704300.1 hypothetical protein BDZ83DRAFT_758790 [Colletotrichum acutatum]